MPVVCKWIDGGDSISSSIADSSRGTLTAILRFAFFFNVPLAEDLSFHGARLVVWTTVEPGVYLIAACLPSLRPLFKHAIKSASVVTGRSRLQSHHSRVGATNTSGVGIALSGVDRSKQTSMGDHDQRSGFTKLNDPHSSGDFGDDIEQKGLVVRYRSSDGDDRDLASNLVSDMADRHWAGTGIMNHR